MSKKQKRILWPVLSILLVAAIAFVFASTRGGAASTNIEANAPRPLPAFSGRPSRSEPTPADMEVETVSITPNGFEPSELRRPAGSFLLAVNNHGRPAEFSFEIYRVNGQRAHEIRGKKGQQRQRRILDLPPGEYVLKEVSHPDWGCKILVSAN
jgi:hypothetical protein